MTYPALEVSFAPGVASSAVPGALDWVDLTSRVASMDIKHGREDEFSQPSAGSMELELDNASGMFDPDAAYDATLRPYAGDLLPLTWFRVRGGDSSVDTDLFYGQVSIEGFRLEASQFTGRMVVRVTVLDMLEQLANTDLPESVWSMQVAANNPLAWYRLSESSGTTASDSSGGGHHGTYEGGATFNTRSSLVANSDDNAIGFDGVNDLVSLPTSAGVSGNDWTIAGWMSHPEVDANDRVIWEQKSVGGQVTTFALSGTTSPDPGELFVQQVTSPTTGDVVVGSARIDDDDAHFVAVVSTAGSINIYVDGVLDATAGAFASATAAESIVVGYGDAANSVASIAGTGLFAGTLDEVMIFDAALSATDVADLYTAGTEPWISERSDERITNLLDAVDFPASLRTVATGDSTVQAATLGTDALSALQEVAKAEGGVVYVDHHDGGKIRFDNRQYRWTDTESITSQATFGDAAGEVTYAAVQLEDDRIINVASVQRANGATITVEDATSVTQYQRRTFSDTGLLFETDAEAASRAALVVAEKKDRQRRVRSVVLEPTATSHPAWPHVFARRISDRVTVKWQPPYGGTYTFPAYVEGVQHTWVPGSSAPWRTVLHLSPVPYGATSEPYFIIGTSTIDGPARIGY